MLGWHGCSGLFWHKAPKAAQRPVEERQRHWRQLADGRSGSQQPKPSSRRADRAEAMATARAEPAPGEARAGVEALPGEPPGAFPPGGAVLQATSFWADILGREAAPGMSAVARLILKPWWETPASALGGGYGEDQREVAGRHARSMIAMADANRRVSAERESALC